MKNKVLLVDDDENMLRVLAANLQSKFSITTAHSASDGLERIRQESFKVVVSDYEMPDMNGVEFLKEVKSVAPHTIRMMITGVTDVAVASDAVNSGEVSRYLTKPVETTDLIPIIYDCVTEYDVAESERNLLESTLNGAVKVLLDMLGLASPLAFSRTNRLRAYADQICQQGFIAEKWSFQLASMLSQVGCISVLPGLLQKVIAGQSLSSEEQAAYNNYPKVGAAMISEIPRLEGVSEIVRYHRKSFSEIESLDLDKNFKQATHAVHFICDFDLAMEAERDYAKAVTKITKQAVSYHPRLMELISELKPYAETMKLTSVTVPNLAPGMIFAQDVKTDDGILLIPDGLEVVASSIAMLTNSIEMQMIDRNRTFQVYEP